MASTDIMVPLDPTKWEEPTEHFIGRLTKCRRSTTDEAKSKDGQTFTELRGWPQAGQTLEVEVERLDAVFVNKVTGEKSPVRRFMTLDLQRWNEREHRMVNAMQGQSKASFTLEKWGNAKVTLHPDPAVREGLVAEWELKRSIKIGKQTAKNVLYPVKVLAAPGSPFDFRGDVEEIEFDPKDDDGAGVSLDDAAETINSAAGANAGNGAGATMSAILDEAGILGLFAGIDPEDESAIMGVIAGHKAAIPATVKTSILSGEYISGAIEAGKLRVEAGLLVVAGA